MKILDNGHGEALLREYTKNVPAIYEKLASFGLRMFRVPSREVTAEEKARGIVGHLIDERALPRLQYAGLIEGYNNGGNDGIVGAAFYHSATKTVIYTEKSTAWDIVHEAVGHGLAAALSPDGENPDCFMRLFVHAAYGERNIPFHIKDTHSPTDYGVGYLCPNKNVADNEYFAEHIPYVLGVPFEASVGNRPDAKFDARIIYLLDTLCKKENKS